MIIGLNLLHAHPDIGGGYQYIQNLVNNLLEFDTKNFYYLFVTKQTHNIISINKTNYKFIYIKINSHSRIKRVFYEQIFLPLKIKKYKINVIHHFGNVGILFSPIKQIVTVHDLLVFKNPKLFRLNNRLYLKIFMKLTLKKAKYILPVSKYTSKDLVNILKIPLNKIIIVPPIISQNYYQRGLDVIRQFKKKYALPDKFWLYVAHTYPHKNHLGLLKIYLELLRKYPNFWPLVFRGDPMLEETKIQEYILKNNLGDKIIRLKKLTIDELATLYSSCTCFLFPSLHEGIGIPVLEAVKCGCYVISNNLPSVKEYCGNSVEYIDVQDKIEFKTTLENFYLGRKKKLNKEIFLDNKTILSRILDAYNN